MEYESARTGYYYKLKHLGYVYGKYFVVGSVAALVSVVVREIISISLKVDTPFYFSVTVVVAYISAIFVSYYGHKLITFSHKDTDDHTMVSLGKFTLIAMLGLLTTTVLSNLYRYALPFDKYFHNLGDTLAFVLAAVSASFVTFAFNSKFTFNGKNKE